jgi:hypothetical protein
MNTEEGFALASLKEFVKLWGSGTKASFHLECKDGQAWFKLSSFLGHPGSPNFASPHSHPEQQYHKTIRSKGPSQVLCDQARAAAHRATKNTSDTAKTAAATADENLTASVDPPTPHSEPPPPAPPSLTAEAADRPTPPSAPPVSPKIAVPALPAASTVATFNEVHDEILLEKKK